MNIETREIRDERDLTPNEKASGQIDNPALPAIGYSLDVWVCLLPMLPIHYERHWR